MRFKTTFSERGLKTESIIKTHTRATNMKRSGRSKRDSEDRLRNELLFKLEIEENNIFLSAGLAYFFVVLFACLTEKVEPYFGIILILTSIMIIWYFMDKRKEIRRRIEAL